MALIEDINGGVTARFLVSPVRREALIAARILKEAVVVVIQSLMLIAARAGFLVALLALSVAFATRAFQSYLRSV